MRFFLICRKFRVTFLGARDGNWSHSNNDYGWTDQNSVKLNVLAAKFSISWSPVDKCLFFTGVSTVSGQPRSQKIH